MANRVVLNVVEGPNATAGCRLAIDSRTQHRRSKVKTTWPDYKVGGLVLCQFGQFRGKPLMIRALAQVVVRGKSNGIGCYSGPECDCRLPASK